MKLRRSHLWCGVVVSIVAALLVWFCVEVRHARRMALAMCAQGRLNQLQLAMRNYHEFHGQFPPAFIADEDGKPMHSWRVLILPFVDEGKLYAEYDFHEPWDGPNNSRLSHRMPVFFHSDTEPPSGTNTNLVVITGPGTAFPGSTSTKLDDFRDGQENTILLTEISNSKIPWLSPQDLSVETMSFRVNDRLKAGISSIAWRKPYVVFADRIRGYPLSQTIPPDALRALTTIAGGEKVIREDLESQGHLGGTSLSGKTR